LDEISHGLSVNLGPVVSHNLSIPSYRNATNGRARIMVDLPQDTQNPCLEADSAHDETLIPEQGPDSSNCRASPVHDIEFGDNDIKVMENIQVPTSDAVICTAISHGSSRSVDSVTGPYIDTVADSVETQTKTDVQLRDSAKRVSDDFNEQFLSSGTLTRTAKSAGLDLGSPDTSTMSLSSITSIVGSRTSDPSASSPSRPPISIDVSRPVRSFCGPPHPSSFTTDAPVYRARLQLSTAQSDVGISSEPDILGRNDESRLLKICDGELEAKSGHTKKGGWSVQVTGVSLRLTGESQPTTGFL
jgi:hypothetical protein